jgi:hypothetical protein
MTTITGDPVQVGHVEIPLSTAVDWVRSYTDIEKNTTGTAPYAYPAYDQYQANEGNDPHRLTDADLLAPVLLNVTPKIRSFYNLQQIRGNLEDALKNPDLERPLAEISDPARIAEMVAPLYAVLDDPKTKPWRVRATLLSKILHRKRPQSLVLHDKWVRACYVGDGKPVPSVPSGQTRTWAEHMTAVTAAIGHDIRTQPAAFAALDRATGTPGQLSRVRLLDILAWKSQGRNPPAATSSGA